MAAAGTADRPADLIGLLLVAPGSRGRYGMTTSDLLGLDPTGEGSFGLADFADQLDPLRVAQFSAGLDPLDDTSWLSSLGTPHRVFNLERTLHDMGGAGEEFQAKLDEALQWTLSSKQ